MNFISAEQDNIDMMLTQMGAKVKSIHGLVCYVSFKFNDTEILYVYNINAKNQYYLQKVLPYPVGAGEFSSPAEVVDYIKKDIHYYKTALKSSIFNDFVDINLKLHKTIHKMEEVFMNYNVPHEKMNEIEGKLNHIDQILNEIQDTSNVYNHQISE